MSDADPDKEIDTDDDAYTVDPSSIPNLPKLTQRAKKAAPSSDTAKSTAPANPAAKKAASSSDATKSTAKANPAAKKTASSSDATKSTHQANPAAKKAASLSDTTKSANQANSAPNDERELTSDIENTKGNENFASDRGPSELAQRDPHARHEDVDMENPDSYIQMETEHPSPEHSPRASSGPAVPTKGIKAMTIASQEATARKRPPPASPPSPGRCPSTPSSLLILTSSQSGIIHHQIFDDQ